MAEAAPSALGPRLARAIAVVTIVAAATLSAGYGPRIQFPDALHLLAHAAIFGSIGALVATGTSSPHRAFAGALVAGAAVEVAQMLGLVVEGLTLLRAIWLLLPESLFDMTVNAVAGATGVALVHRSRAAAPMGLWLHPIVIGPPATYGLGWAASGRRTLGIFWTLALIASFAPAVLGWIVGLYLGHHSDVDLRERSERPVLFLGATGCAALYAYATYRVASPPYPMFGAILLLSTVLTTLVTTAGLKLSGHVAAPLTLAAVMVHHSPRGAAVLLGCSVLLSWARIADSCHTPREVAAAWAMGATLYAASLGL